MGKFENAVKSSSDNRLQWFQKHFEGFWSYFLKMYFLKCCMLSVNCWMLRNEILLFELELWSVFFSRIHVIFMKFYSLFRFQYYRYTSGNSNESSKMVQCYKFNFLYLGSIQHFQKSIFKKSVQKPSKCFWNHENPMSERKVISISKFTQKALVLVSDFPKSANQIGGIVLKFAAGAKFGRFEVQSI